MIDPIIMTGDQKRSYIFDDNPPWDRGRFDWIEGALLGDVRTFLDGVEGYLNRNHNNVVYQDGNRRGAGNLNIPIPLCSLLELVSALFAGKTQKKKIVIVRNF